MRHVGLITLQAASPITGEDSTYDSELLRYQMLRVCAANKSRFKHSYCLRLQTSDLMIFRLKKAFCSNLDDSKKKKKKEDSSVAVFERSEACPPEAISGVRLHSRSDFVSQIARRSFSQEAVSSCSVPVDSRLDFASTSRRQEATHSWLGMRSRGQNDAGAKARQGMGHRRSAFKGFFSTPSQTSRLHESSFLSKCLWWLNDGTIIHQPVTGPVASA